MSTAPKRPVILISGASQGIGAAIAKVFAKEMPSARLALVARHAANLEKVAKACEKLGTNAEIFTCDVSDAGAVSALSGVISKRYGRVDVLINNAGSFVPASFADTTVEQFDNLIASNLRSAFLLTKAFLPGMVERKYGDVFFMSSIAGLDAYPNSSAYCAAKFGVTGLAKVVRAETRESGVRVCTVCPGATWSPSWSSSGVEPERIMPAEDVARAFLDIYRLGRNTVIEEIVLRPQLGDL